MENIYHSTPAGTFFRASGLILSVCLLLQQAGFAQGPQIVEGQRFEVQENTPGGTSVGNIQAFDITEGDAVFSIEGAEASFYRINSSTGELTVNAPLDYEIDPSYIQTVQVEEGEENHQAEITIDLLNVLAPKVVTGNASAVSENSATLDGVVDPNGFPATAVIQYGRTAALGGAFEADGMVNLNGNEGETTLQLHLTELQAGTTYYYRTAAKNNDGVYFGSTKSFSTLTIPTVEGIAIRDSNPTNSDELNFLVTFSEPVNGVDETDFELQKVTSEGGTTLVGELKGVAPFGTEGKEFVVTIHQVDGDGTLKLVLKDDNSIESLKGVKLGGGALGDGDFEDGEIYTIDNTAPSAYTLIYTNEDVPVTYSFAVNDLPNNSDNLTVDFFSHNPELIPANSYEFLGTGNSRKVRITPKANAHGETKVEVTVKDNAGNVGTTIEIYVVVRAVADAPELIAHDVSGPEDTDIPLEVGVNLIDKDGSELLRNIQISGVPSGGTLIPGNSLGNGVFEYTDASQLDHVIFRPKKEEYGTYTFTLSATAIETESDKDKLTKKQASASKDFQVTVILVNDPPKFILSESVVTREEDFEDIVKVTPSLVEVPADEADQEVSYSISPAAASVTFAKVSFDETTGEITIASEPDLFGEQVFTITATDEGGASYSQPFTLIVTPVNDVPSFTLSADEVEKEEDFEGVVVVDLTSETPENEVEAIYSISPESVPFAEISFNTATGTLSITSLPDRFGKQDFTITATDDDGVSFEKPFTLVVKPVNDPPVFTIYPKEVEVDEDFVTTEKVVSTLVTPFKWGEEGESVTFSLRSPEIDFADITIDPVSGEVSITSIPDKNGEGEISIVATDNGNPEPAEWIETFRLIVNPVSDEPYQSADLEDLSTLEDELFSYTIPDGTFTDPDGDETLIYSAGLANGGELPQWLDFHAATKTFSGTPDGPDVGDYEIKVMVKDDQTELEDSFVLTVVPVNDVPLISAIDDFAVDIGEIVPPIVFTVSDEETPAANLQVSVVGDNDVLLPASAIILSGEGETKTLQLTPELEEYGVSVITITVSDGETEGTETFSFTVNYKALELNIPDLITPNGDNANDTWNIRYLTLYETNQLRVFDRFGRLVFEAKDYHKGREWDGTQGGKDLPEGAYLYELILNNGAIKKRGTLTIAR